MRSAVVLLAVLCLPAPGQFAGWPTMPEEAAALLTGGDPEAALAYLRTRAEAGEAIPTFWLGRFLEEVQGVPRDYLGAMSSYRKAAAAGIGVAAWSAGRLHEMGRGTPIDPVEAAAWYKKASALGFHRTALTVVKARWHPGTGPLEYEPVPAPLRIPPPPPSPDLAFLSKPPPDILEEELAGLREAGLRGRLVWTGGEPGLFGLPARLILIAQRPVVAEARLALPVDGVILYVQGIDDTWRSYGGGKASGRHAVIRPQSPETPWVTSVSMEMEDGGTQGGMGWSWAGP